MSVNIEKTIKNLEKNNMEIFFIESRKKVVPLIEKMIKPGAIVSVGGSITLDETGVLEHLRSGRYNFLDRYKEGLRGEEIKEIFAKCSSADVYLSSTNAITEDGELYNVDGNANRISAIAFGPKEVIIVAGVNKIVKNIDEAVKRVKTIAAPKNCVRLNRDTFCAKNGVCANMSGVMGKGCDSKDRICRHYLVSARQSNFGRIKVIIVNEDLGY